MSDQSPHSSDLPPIVPHKLIRLPKMPKISVSKERHVIPGAIAAVVAASVGYGSATLSHSPSVVTHVTEVGTLTKKIVARADRWKWGELDQSEIDALTAGLKAMSSPRSILILCFVASSCDDIAMDFDNAFESAHWKSQMQRPIFDDTIGIATNQIDVMNLINTVTNGRLKVAILPPRKNASCKPDANGNPTSCDPPMLVIGKKR